MIIKSRILITVLLKVDFSIRHLTYVVVSAPVLIKSILINEIVLSILTNIN